MRRPAIRSFAGLFLLLAIYYAVPQGLFPSAVAAALSLLALVGGGILLAWLIVGQVKRQLHATSDEGVQMQGLLLLAYLGVIVFALGYFFLARSTDDQFAGLRTKTDALYFTITTLGTVGFGDVHPTGQAARAIVTAQIVFNLVFLGTLARLLTGRIQERAAARRREVVEAGAAPPEPGRPT